MSLVLQVLHLIFEEAGATLFIRLTFTSVINNTGLFSLQIADSGEQFKSEPDHLHETYVEDSFSFFLASFSADPAPAATTISQCTEMRRISSFTVLILAFCLYNTPYRSAVLILSFTIRQL